MATPAYATDLNDIWLEGGGTSWTLITTGGGGSNSQTDPETDDYIQGSSAWSRNPWSSSIRGGVVASSETVASGDAVYFWLKADAIAALASHASGGMQALIGDSSSVLDCFYVRGSDDYAYGGWVCVPVDPTLTPSTTVGGGASGTSVFGCRWNIPSSGPSKGYPFKVDAMRHGRQIIVTDGDSGDPATWDKLAAYDVGLSGGVNTRQWGICQPTNTGAALQGIIYWGSGSLVYSRDSNRTVAIIDTEWTATDFTQIIFDHASNDIEWDNVGLIALGTSNRGIIDVQTDGPVTWTNSVFQGIDTTNLLASSVFDGSKWLGCNTITNAAGSMVGCSVLTPTIAADTSAVIWDVGSDPDTDLDGMLFEKGSAAHHAIEFGTSAPTDITLRNMTFTGFNATDEQNDSTLNFLRTSGSTTVNIEGTGTSAASIGYKTTGTHTVTIVGSVTLTLKNVVSGSQCGIYAVDDGSELMNEAATGGDVTEAYTGSTPRDVIIRVRKASSAPKYKAYIASGQIVSGTGLTVSIDQITDPTAV